MVHLSEFEANSSMCRQQPGISRADKYVTIHVDTLYGVTNLGSGGRLVSTSSERQHRYSIDKYLRGERLYKANLVGCYIICGRREDVRFENHDPFGCSEWDMKRKLCYSPG